MKPRRIFRIMFLLFLATASAELRGDITGPDPTPEHPYGWRGDGSGRYPTANPPTEWERRMITPLEHLTCQAGQPSNLELPGGDSLDRVKSTFEPTHWLLLAPLPARADDDKTLRTPSIDNESNVSPAEGGRVGELKWTTVASEHGIGFFPILGRQDGNKVALLSSWVYSPVAAEFGFRCEGNHGNWIWFLNGKPENQWDQARHQLRAGWNHLLLKIVMRARESNSRAEPELFPFPGPDLSYRTRNIAWTCPMPGPSYAMPMMVGDRLYVTSEPNDLICIDKNSGKPLWLACDTLWQAAIQSEPLSPPSLELVSASSRTLTLAANTTLDPSLATAVSSYSIAGATLAKAELSPHGTTVRLTSEHPWPFTDGQTVQIGLSLKTSAGRAINTPSSFVFQPGHSLGARPLGELLVGPVVTKIDPMKVLHAAPDAGRPETEFHDWACHPSIDGVFDFNALVGDRINAVVPVATHLHSIADQTVQLWIRSDDGARVYLNGRFLHATPGNRWLGQGPEKIADVSLHRGWNTLAMDIVQGSGDWAAEITVMDAAGQKAPAGLSEQALGPEAAQTGPLEDQSPLERLRPLNDQLLALNQQYLQAPDLKLNQRRRKLAQELTDQVKKIDKRYGVSLGWGGGNSTPTPCSDGKVVYTWRGETGVLSCYDLGGRLLWSRFQHTGDDAEHGFNSSPIIAGHVIGLIGGARVFGFDRDTGATLWKQRYPHPCYASLVATKVAGQELFVTPVGMVLRASDGKVLQKAVGRFDGECASPALDGDRFYLVARAGFCSLGIPRTVSPDPRRDPTLGQLAPEELQDLETYPVGSPLCDRGLVYFTHSGWTGHQEPYLFVIDPAESRPKLLYRQKLDVSTEIHYAPDGPGVAASIALAGDSLFVMSNRGDSVVFKPGRTYRQVSRNTIESLGPDGRPEITESTPIFDGDRLYYRGEHNLYCIRAAH